MLLGSGRQFETEGPGARLCPGGVWGRGATIGHRRSLSDALRFAGQEGGASRKRRPCPLFLRVVHWAFCVHLGQSALAHGSAVGLSDCLGAGDLSLNVIRGRWRCFPGFRFPNAFLGRACRFMLGGVRSSIARLSLSFLVEADSNRRKLQRSARVGWGRKGALMALAWVDPVENASVILLFSKPFCARIGPWHVNQRLLDACRRVGKKSPGAPREAGGGQSLSGRKALPAGCPVGVLLNVMLSFFLLFFSDLRAWNRRRRWLAALGPFIAGRNVEFNGREGGESTKMRVFVAGRPPGRLRLVFAPPFLPAKVHGGLRRPEAAASGADHGAAPSMLFAAFAMNPVRAKSSRPAG